jgi:hypothetical protein
LGSTLVNEYILSQNLQAQGYFLVNNFWAPDVAKAIVLAKQYLKNELNRLKVENKKLRIENNNSMYGNHDKANID